MNEFLVKDVKVGELDSTGAPILTVYGKVIGKTGGRYAVYRTDRQVMIQFSDDDTDGVNQRANLSPIGPLRSQITTMISKLWNQSAPYQLEKAEEYSNRLGVSLLIALQGNVPLAATVLETIRDDMIEDTASDTRTWHMLWASLAMLSMIVLSSIMVSSGFMSAFSGLGIDENVWRGSWHAAALGSIGALFSIALQIRARQVRIDSRPWDNISDAVLRVLVGSTSGAVVTALFFGGIVGINIGSTSLRATGWGFFIIAFAGGFTERLVSDFLAKIGLTGNISTSAARSAPANERTVTGNAQSATATPAADAKPADAAPASAQAAPAADPSEETPEPDEDSEDAEGDASTNTGTPPGPAPVG